MTTTLNFFKCPECFAIFTDEKSLIDHSAVAHHWDNLTRLFIARVMLTSDNLCDNCGTSAERLESVRCYAQHMTRKHWGILKLENPNVLTDFFKLSQENATILNEKFDDDMIIDHEEVVTFEGDTTIINTVIHTRSSSPVFPGQLPLVTFDHTYGLGLTHTPTLSNKPADKPKSPYFLRKKNPDLESPEPAKSSARPRKSKKVTSEAERIPPREARFKCPECSKSFNHVSSLYIHSALRHYSQPLTKLFKKGHLLSGEKCNICAAQVVNKSITYILHLGGKHKLIHNVMSPELLKEYQKLPVKKLYSGYVKAKLKPLMCLLCSDKKMFSNITKYKQHLAIYHFRKKIEESHMTSKEKGFSCQICQVTKTFPKPGTLVLHLGAVHNVVLDYADEELKKQLESYVDK